MIKISCCIITLNQADRLEMAIRDVVNFVDEVVVIDGGSEDNSVQVAEKLGAKVYYRKWDDDFGAQRNYSIEKAKNDWVFILDSDESLKFGENYDLKKIISENPKNDGFCFIRANYLDKKQSGSEYDFDKQLRLFKRYGYYNEKIHEVAKGLKNVIDIGKTKCLILHYKSKDEQQKHLVYQKKIIINTIKELEKKSKLTPEEGELLNYERKMLKAWDSWWQDAN